MMRDERYGLIPHPSSFISHPSSATVLTPPGRGAVATVLVSGCEATTVVGKLFATASGDDFVAARDGQIVYGRWAGPPGEELVVCRRSDDEIEIHCHGGEAAVAAVLNSLSDFGCRETPWSEAIRWRADDLLAADAAEALAHATTQRTAAILLDQYHGALRRELDQCATLLESSEESSWREAESRLQVLRARGRLGRHLIDPFRVVIAGKPNVGKSSLINALVGYQRSIVYDQPGTTRDVVSVRTAIAGWPVDLSDTAGLCRSGDALEAAGVQLALERLSAADLRVLVFDASQRWGSDDEALAARWPDAVVVHNKSDLPTPQKRPGEGISTSAVTGVGLEELVRAVGERLVPEAPPPGAAVPFHESHEMVVAAAIECLLTGNRAGAACRLREFRRRPA